jgi:nucleotide-binding universal stress UspA family protein
MKGRVMLSIRTIIHPTDFSEHADYAFRLACALARDYDARLLVVHVAPVVVYGEGLMPLGPDTLTDELRDCLHKVDDPAVKIEHRMLEGGAASEILRLAQETDCDLIVMGTHGRSGIGRLLLGSVADLVMRKAPCPVLTVKTNPMAAGTASAREDSASVR